MAKNNNTKLESQLLELIETSGIDNTFLEKALKMILEKTMELEITELLGASKSEQTKGRKGYRSGTRRRRLDTRIGTFYLDVPKVRCGGYIPSFFEPYKRHEKALITAIGQMYVSGTSTRKTQSILRKLGIEDISASEVSHLNKALDKEVEAFRNRDLSKNNYLFIYVDALYEKIRFDSRVISSAVQIVCGIDEQGYREIIAIEPMLNESYETYCDLFSSLKKRGMNDPLMVISDAHKGLVKAITDSFIGCSWQRCKVHFQRNILAHVPHYAKKNFSAHLKQIWIQPDVESARDKAKEVIERFASKYAKAISVLEEGLEDSLSYYYFVGLVPTLDHRKISSTNVIERLNLEVRRRTSKVGIFPDTSSYIRLVTTFMIEYSEEWSLSRHYLNPEVLSELLTILSETKDKILT